MLFVHFKVVPNRMIKDDVLLFSDSDSDSDYFIVTVFKMYTFRKREMLIFLGSSTVIDFTIQ